MSSIQKQVEKVGLWMVIVYVLILFSANQCSAQVVYKSKKWDADMFICITENKWQADRIVYYTKNKWEANSYGIVYWSSNKWEADTKIYFTKQKWSADELCY